MRPFRRYLSAIAFSAGFVGMAPAYAGPVICEFSGTVVLGGTDCLGHSLAFPGSGFPTFTTLGTPGSITGSTTYLGDVDAFDFHIEFFDLGDATISTLGTFVANEVPNSWTRSATGNTVWFEATPNHELSPGDTFFWNVFFNGTVSQNARYEGSWTTIAVPEPGTLALLGAGLIGLSLRRRRVA